MQDTTGSGGPGGTAQVAKEQAASVASAAAEQTGQVAGAAVEGTREVATVATQTAAEVAGAVKEQVAGVAGEAKTQVRNLVEESKSQLRSQAQTQTETIASQLRKLGDQVQALVDGRTAEAGPVGDYVKQAASTVNDLAGRIETKGFEGVVEDVTRFARRRPGTFLLGALAAGFGVGRLVRQAGGPEAPSPALSTGSDVPHPMPVHQLPVDTALEADPTVVDVTDGSMAPLATEPAVPAGLTATGDPLASTITGAGGGSGQP